MKICHQRLRKHAKPKTACHRKYVLLWHFCSVSERLLWFWRACHNSPSPRIRGCQILNKLAHKRSAANVSRLINWMEWDWTSFTWPKKPLPFYTYIMMWPSLSQFFYRTLTIIKQENKCQIPTLVKLYGIVLHLLGVFMVVAMGHKAVFVLS